MNEIILLPVLVLALIYSTSAAPAPQPLHPNKVTSLPGAPLHPEFNLFSGYLNGSSDGNSAQLFYLLAEAIRVDPSTAPLVVWFNGGPGGSSLGGFFKEHGPYRIMEAGELTYHELSWNQYANVLYLESPLGVGFSQNDDGKWTLNDDDAANVNFYALRDLMSRVHPNYASNDYYLSGQSYAGAYVPYLARRLWEGIHSGEMKNKNFKGFAIGNPVIEQDMRALATAMKFLSYGLIPPGRTNEVIEIWKKHSLGDKINKKDREILQYMVFEVIESTFGPNSPINYNFVEHCYNQSYSKETYHVSTEKASIACYGGNALESFLNRIDVQTALHIANFNMGAKSWSAINIPMNSLYTRDRDVLHVYDDLFRLVNESSFRVLVYHGDTDLMLPTVHSIESIRTIAESNGMEVQKQSNDWRFYGDFAGIRNGYKSRATTMDVITVRGAGHSVPTDLPGQAFQMINNFIFTEEDEEIDYSRPTRKHF